MKVLIVKEVMTCDVSPVAMFSPLAGLSPVYCCQVFANFVLPAKPKDSKLFLSNSSPRNAIGWLAPFGCMIMDSI